MFIIVNWTLSLPPWTSYCISKSDLPQLKGQKKIPIQFNPESLLENKSFIPAVIIYVLVRCDSKSTPQILHLQRDHHHTWVALNFAYTYYAKIIVAIIHIQDVCSMQNTCRGRFRCIFRVAIHSIRCEKKI